MRVWQAAEELCREVHLLLPHIRPLAHNAADHLERSTDSVLFNIGEGAGAYRPRVKISAYEVAKKEANEIRAILRSIVIKRVLTESQIRRAYNLAGAVVGMLTQAIISIQKRPDM
jgi:four helix bundle protein